MLEIMHKFINNYDIIGQNVGQIRQTSGTKSETTGTIVPVVNMLKYALGCSILHAACMQDACRLHYASSVAASIEIHVHIPGVDAVCTASTPCIPGSTPCTPASTPCMQAASRLHAGRRRQENTPRMNMLILGVFFRAYFSIFSLWQHVLML